MINKKISFIVLFLLFTYTSTLFSQSSRTLPFLEINSDARAAAMGNSSLGKAESMYLYTNPASFLHQKTAMYGSYTVGIYPRVNDSKQWYHAASAGYSFFEKHAIMVGFRSLSGHEIATFDEAGEGEPIFPSDRAIDALYAYKLANNIVVYATGNFIRSDLGVVANTTAVGAGASYTRRHQFTQYVGSYTLSASLTNLGGKIRYGKDGAAYNLPTSVNFGGSLTFPFHVNHQLQADFTSRYYMLSTGENELTGGIGLEYNIIKTIAMRTGYHWGDSNNYFTAGAGVKKSFLQLNAAYQMNRFKEYSLFLVGFNVML